ncbi:hypothetical protein EIN_330400 [Entamoeba invadens IP1]|uniref:Uncharacterized protein n=1 Tax=Entamoeba invadens IP1 TaxID=370355 RepID=L7FNS9_ENTIV|nr:hypothetical protein EIN_330400 [Entamoeba invadens IP1]ELP88756.1 hypothetical protein EIN_330400 [Entamoeba invadens IP1]|eukprot:XP_004255527.1 hypothetical protein EIN_330400 [Entamoeba invadens IP1]
MDLDDKADAENIAADQSDRRKNIEDQIKALNAKSLDESKLQEVQFNLDKTNNTKEKLIKKVNELIVQVDQLTDEKKKDEKDLEKMDKMIKDSNAKVDKAQKQLDTTNDDKDGNEAMKQKYQDELKSVRTELDQEKKDHSKTQLIKGKYEKDIAEIIVRAETLEKKSKWLNKRRLRL